MMRWHADVSQAIRGLGPLTLGPKDPRGTSGPRLLSTGRNLSGETEGASSQVVVRIAAGTRESRGEGVMAVQTPPKPAGASEVPVAREAPEASIDLFWLPLGAGGWFVRLNGRIYEAIRAHRERRRP